MLDPDLVLESVVLAFRAIPTVVDEMSGDPLRIVGHQYRYGTDDSIARTVFQRESPSIVVAYLDLLWGKFSGAEMWKHRLEVYLQPRNATTTPPNGAPPPASAPHLWWMMMNLPVVGYANDTLNFRNLSLTHASFPTNGGLLPVESPSLMHRQDENLADLHVGALILGEWGDS